MRKLLFSCLACLLGCQSPLEGGEASYLPDHYTTASLAGYVDPFIGTGGHGHTYPGASLPFGMLQLSPDTRLEGWDGCSGYHHSDSLVYGFSHTHLSGTGVSDYGDILLMPTAGPLRFHNGADGQPGYRSRFDKRTEVAEPGYYACQLTDYGISVELTATQRVGMHRYRFSGTDTGQVILDLSHRDVLLDHQLKVVSETEVRGHRISTAWAREQHVYFVARFSRPALEVRVGEEGKKAALRFLPGEELLVKVGISFVDEAGAEKNLEAELPDWDAERVRREATEAWNQQLSRVLLEDESEENKTIFYTAQYHASLVPNCFMDVDGRYRGMDGKIHQNPSGQTRYSVFSLWDTYRAAHPWYTLTEQARTRDFIRTLLQQHEEGGKLPMWELAGNYTGCMIGYHAVPVIYDAYAKGLRDYDTALALQAMVATARADELGKRAYARSGFVPAEEEAESVSKTLEYAYDDCCIGRMAGEMGEEALAHEFMGRAQSWQNLLDPETRFMRARYNQRWETPFDPTQVTFAYTEANAWQYSFYVPHDLKGFAEMMGGEAALEKRLDQLFETEVEVTGRDMKDISGLVGQYAHGNEPSHHIAYLYNYLAKPWKSQAMVHRILREMYSSAPDGLSGNEDCGQMSAWYLFSALGFYPVLPGSNQYVFGSPVFREATLQLENGKRFSITTQNLSPQTPYLQEVILNGQAISRNYLWHEEIMAGGSLEFVMGETPNKARGTQPADRPFSELSGTRQCPVPALSQGKRSFFGQDTVAFNHLFPEARIFYTLHGQPPAIDSLGQPLDAHTRLYVGPFVIDSSCQLLARAWLPGREISPLMEAQFTRLSQNRQISLGTAYASYYAAGGDRALIDGLTGGRDFRTGDWQGYHGVDLLATVDLGEIEKPDSVSISFLQDNNSWIFMPLKVSFQASSDGKSYNSLAELRPRTSPRQAGTLIERFAVPVGKAVRYLRIHAENQGTCPPWHKGAGGKAWVFADEILVR